MVHPFFEAPVGYNSRYFSDPQINDLYRSRLENVQIKSKRCSNTSRVPIPFEIRKTWG